MAIDRLSPPPQQHVIGWRARWCKLFPSQAGEVKRLHHGSLSNGGGRHTTHIQPDSGRHGMCSARHAPLFVSLVVGALPYLPVRVASPCASWIA